VEQQEHAADHHHDETGERDPAEPDGPPVGEEPAAQVLGQQHMRSREEDSYLSDLRRSANVTSG
jgi:hypothetical protein